MYYDESEVFFLEVLGGSVAALILVSFIQCSLWCFASVTISRYNT